MPDFVATVRRLVGRVLSGRGDNAGAEPLEQITAVVDGATAVAIVEACAAEAAGVGPNDLGVDAHVSAFERRVTDHRANLLGRAVSGVAAPDARAALATTIGLATSGLRATAFVGAGDLQSAHDQLVAAAGRHLPLVVHLGGRANGGPGVAVGSGHEAYHAAADTGLVQLFAVDVQHAVDLSLIARRVAERALVPVLVATDWEQTARSLQDVQLPSAALVRAYLGRSSDRIEAPTPAQRMLFGDTRRRVPRWYDLQRPALQGAVFGTESYGVAAAGRRLFFEAHVPALLDDACAELARLTGRATATLREHAVDRAEVIVVAQGAAVETAIAVADHMRRHDKLRVGVVGVSCLRPFPSERLAQICTRARRVVVAERTDAVLGGDPPLLRELAAALQRAGGGKAGAPALASAIYGVGGLALRAADLRAAILSDGEVAGYVGIELAPRHSDLPKRQVLLDQLRRDYPGLSEHQRVADEPLVLTPADGVHAAIYRTAGTAAGVVGIAARTLGHAVAGHVRARADEGWERWGKRVRDRLVVAGDSVPVIAEEALVDAAVVCGPIAAVADVAVAGLRPGGVLVFDAAATPDVIAASFSPRALARLRRNGAAVFCSAPVAGETAALRDQRLAGGLLAALVETSRIAVSRRKLVAARDAGTDGVDVDAAAQAFATGFDDVAPIVVGGTAGRELAARRPPAAVGHLQPRDHDAEHASDSLPRFWNQVGVLYEDPDQLAPTLSADPYLAAGIVPPLSAALRGPRDAAAMLPRFEPANCTGCARCWIRCPDGAIAAAAYRPAELFDAGVALARASGNDASALQPMINKLAPLVNTYLGANDDAPTGAESLLAAACGDTLDAAPLPDERKQKLVAAFAAATGALGSLPVARTETLFDVPERSKSGSGGLLALAIDPNACKGCGVCISACADDALLAEATTPARVAAAEQTWAAWQQLPDTSSEVIREAQQNDQLGDLAALLLSRHCAYAMAGADGTEPGSGARLALRLVMAAAEFGLQRNLQQQVQRVSDVRAELAARLRESLAQALPTADLEALAGKLDAVSTSGARLGELVDGADAVDVARTRRLVEAARALDDLHQRLTEGAFGLGRSRLGLVLAPDALTEGISAFPYNPFAVPTIIDTSGEAAPLARGALEGQLRALCEDVAVVRRAELELSAPARAAMADAELAQLGWADLTDAERAQGAPLVLVGGSAAFSDRALSRLVDGDLPVKVVLLSDGAGADDAHWSGRTAVGALAFGLSNPNLFVLQSSLAFPDHLGPGLLRALAHPGPALIHLLAPSPSHHGFASDAAVAQAELAVVSRVFPLVLFDPSAEGVFGTHISLAGNPEPLESWCSADGGVVTPATWARSQGRFADWFAPLDGATGTPISDFLELDAKARANATPALGDERLAAEAVSLCERRGREWRVLSELAGLKTPFTERVRAEAEAAVAAGHAAELAAVRAEHSTAMAAARAEFRAQAAAQIRERLLSLAGYGNGRAKEKR